MKNKKLKKYKITSDFVSAKFDGYVEANNEKEAIQKWYDGNTIGDIDESPVREEININIEEV